LLPVFLCSTLTIINKNKPVIAHNVMNTEFAGYENDYFCNLFAMINFLLRINPIFMRILSNVSRISFLLFIFAIVFSFQSFSQVFVIDTTSFLYSEDTLSIGPYDFDYEQPFEEIGTESDFIPGDIIFVPSDVRFNSRWDTLYIRTGRVDFSKLEDTTIIQLNNPAQDKFCFPFKGKLLSKYGQRGRRFHAGMDIKLELGDTVRNAFDGKVRIARVMSGYGKMVVVRHSNGLETVYGHLSKILVDINQEVRAGEPLGLGGRTGRATTTHLHFETRFLGEHFNPARFIDFENFCLNQDKLVIDKNFMGKSPDPGSITKHTSSNSENSVSAKYHTIQSGDTLYAMALRYKTTVPKICKLNGISESKKLKIGTRLKVK